MKKIAVVLLGIMFVSGCTIVPAGHKGVRLRFGAVSKHVLSEGLHTSLPILSPVVKMSVQVKAYTARAASASRDLQDVKTTVTVNYRLNPAEVSTVFQKIGRDYEEVLIVPAVQESVKATTATFNAEQLVTERPKVKDAIERAIQGRLRSRGIIVEAVSITNFSFAAEFTRAVEMKVKATQDALRARNDLVRVKTEAEQKISRAMAEAESLKIQSKQVTPIMIELRAVEKWDGKLPSTMCGSGAMPFMKIGK